MRANPVFDDSFPEGKVDPQATLSRFGEVAGHYTLLLTKVVNEGSPDIAPERLRELVGGLMLTCVGFGAGLGEEIEDREGLGTLAALIGVTGWANWLPTEDGDEAMPLAIDGLSGGSGLHIPVHMTGRVRARSRGLGYMEGFTTAILRPEDVATSLGASHELVRHGMLAHRWSMQYKEARRTGQGWRFLNDAHTSEEVARSLIVTGALPSAVAPLYGMYRHEYSDWPELAEVFGESEILEMHQIANALIRCFDDEGDQDVDKWAFSINLFNQPHDVLLGAFLRQAGVDSPTLIKELTGAFVDARDPSAAERITSFFKVHIQERVSGLSPEVKRKYPGYITLCKRGVEAAYVNRVGYEKVTAPLME